jgi:hypothetical protein
VPQPRRPRGRGARRAEREHDPPRRAAASEQALARRRDEERREVEFALIAERENGMALALLLLIVALGAGGAAFVLHERGERQRIKIAAAAGCSRSAARRSRGSAPGFDEVEGRLEELLHAEMEAEDSGPVAAAASARWSACSIPSAAA